MLGRDDTKEDLLLWNFRQQLIDLSLEYLRQRLKAAWREDLDSDLEFMRIARYIRSNDGLKTPHLPDDTYDRIDSFISAFLSKMGFAYSIWHLGRDDASSRYEVVYEILSLLKRAKVSKISETLTTISENNEYKNGKVGHLAREALKHLEPVKQVKKAAYKEKLDMALAIYHAELSKGDAEYDSGTDTDETISIDSEHLDLVATA